MNTPFEITREEVLNLAAQKLADNFANEEDLYSKAQSLIEVRVSEVVSKGLKERVEAAITKEIEQLMQKEIVPVDIWGEKCGEPTTIRAELHKRAKDFWDTKVNDDGREYSYGEPRYQKLLKQVVKDEFAQAVKDNSQQIISAFKAALKEGTVSIVAAHIDQLIKVK